MTLPTTVSPLEILCIAVTASGMVGCGRNLYYAAAERAALRRAHKRGEVRGTDYDAKCLLTHANVRATSVGGALFSGALILSVIWALTPPAVRASVNFASFATSVFILVVAVIATITVWINGIERLKLYDMARKAERERSMQEDGC